MIGMCYTETERDGKVTSATHFFIGSRKAKAKVHGNALRGHTGVSKINYTGNWMWDLMRIRTGSASAMVRRTWL